jgi:nucleotide-binding universal stress UspA family protein
MRKILVPVDGSDLSDAAVRAVVAQARREPIAAIHLLNVQPKPSRYLGRFVSRAAWRDMQREQAEKALVEARRILDNAGLPYDVHVEVGKTPAAIARTADALRVHEIVMGAEGGGLFANIRLWLLVSAVRRHATLPVVVVMNPERSPELALRWGTTASR